MRSSAECPQNSKTQPETLYMQTNVEAFLLKNWMTQRHFAAIR